MDWPFTFTYCSIVLCFDVGSTWKVSRKKKGTLDPSFCMSRTCKCKLV